MPGATPLLQAPPPLGISAKSKSPYPTDLGQLILAGAGQSWGVPTPQPPCRPPSATFSAWCQGCPPHPSPVRITPSPAPTRGPPRPALPPRRLAIFAPSSLACALLGSILSPPPHLTGGGTTDTTTLATPLLHRPPDPSSGAGVPPGYSRRPGDEQGLGSPRPLGLGGEAGVPGRPPSPPWPPSWESGSRSGGQGCCRAWQWEQVFPHLLPPLLLLVLPCLSLSLSLFFFFSSFFP